MSISPPIDSIQRRRTADRVARRAVQIGFLLLFLYPLFLVIYQRITFRAAPNLASWLLPWDPLLFAGHLARREWAGLVIGAPLLLIALTLLLGRFFCGWVCPVGTVLDLLRPLAFWQKRRKPARAPRLFPANANSHLRYYLLIAVALAGLFSLQALGLLDPLVIFQRATTALINNVFTLRQPPLRAFFSIVSLLFVAIVALELWQPRFWCRNLCPLGALISLFSRFSLFNRRVSSACSFCGDCRRACVMNAIPRKEPHDTDYSDCTFCLECESACPNTGISFAFGTLAGKRWQKSANSKWQIADSEHLHLRRSAAQVQVSASQQDDKATNRRTPALTSERSVGASVSESAHSSLPLSHPLLLPLADSRFQGSYQPKSEQFRAALTRRKLFGGLAAGAVGLALAPAVARDRRGGVLRPPGALHEAAFVRTCILCQECVRVCPTGGLKPTAFEAGLAAVGTPQLVPLAGACTRNPSCPGLCAQVCPVGAIQPIAPEQVKIGRAVVDHPLCLAWDQQVKCLVCVEACLVEAAQVYNGRIVVDPQRCTGCGRCENACPVAGSAIHVRPFSTSG